MMYCLSVLELIFNKTANTNLHARKHNVVGCEKQMRKITSHRRSLISAFLICSLLNLIAKVARPEISLL